MRASVVELDLRWQIYWSGILHNEREQFGEQLVKAALCTGLAGIGDEITDSAHWEERWRG